MKYFKHILTIIVGNMLLAFATTCLILENHIIVGGVSGIGAVLKAFLDIPVSLSVAILNVTLFSIGLIFIGKKFAASTLLSTILFPFFLSIFERTSYFHGLLQDTLLVCLIAGCFVGFGLGIVIKAGASTGGVDIVAILANKKLGIPVSISMYTIDFLVLLCQVPMNDITHIVYGIVIVIVTSLVLNKTLTMGTGLIQLTIMSDSYEQIRNMILIDQNAGVTLLHSEKGYTRNNSKLVLSIIPYRKLPEIKKRVLEIDPLAFIVVAHVDDVSGMGFTLERVYE